MKLSFYLRSLLLMVLVLASLTSCQAMGDLIGFGFWSGIIITVLVALLLVWIFNRFRRR